MLVDPDNFEEDVCNETVTVAVDAGKILSIEKHGGAHIGKDALTDCVVLAMKAWKDFQQKLS